MFFSLGFILAGHWEKTHTRVATVLSRFRGAIGNQDRELFPKHVTRSRQVDSNRDLVTKIPRSYPLGHDNCIIYTHIEFEGSNGEPCRRSRPGQPDEVAWSDVTGEQRRPNGPP